MEERRVVCTGIGAVTPLGKNVSENERRLNNGETAIRNIVCDYEWLGDYNVQIGSVFGKGNKNGDFEFDYERIGLDRKEQKRLSKFTQYALVAAHEAVLDSGILDCRDYQDKTGLTLGVGFGGIHGIEAAEEELIKKGLRRVSPLFISKVIPDAASGEIAKLYGLHGTEAKSVSSACATGASAVVDACKSIKLGEVEMIICGGTEEPISPLPFASFGNMRATTDKFNDNPEKASRPFDRKRSGFVCGEGAGALVLESLEHAKKRGAKIYGEILGYGTTCDAYHLTQPSLDAEFTSLAISNAIKRSGLNPTQIDYINSHGTSTPYNDALETLAIKKALGEHAYNVSLNSTKSMLGHTFGAAGALELIVTLLTLNSGIIHPTLNLEEKDLEPWTHKGLENVDRNAACDLGYCNRAIERPVNYALSNSFGFFGHNVVLAVGKEG